jgi:hypothetical protein
MEGKLTESDVLRIAAKLSKKLDKEIGEKAPSSTVDRILEALVVGRTAYLTVTKSN